MGLAGLPCPHDRGGAVTNCHNCRLTTAGETPNVNGMDDSINTKRRGCDAAAGLRADEARATLSSNGTPRRHLLVAGTGRAGTSAVVRNLHGIGLETHLSRKRDAEWDEAAQAGLEDSLIPLVPDAPYVVKCPGSYQFVDQVLSDPTIQIDGAIIPIRRLTEAASSRAIIQLQSIHEAAPWMTDMVDTWDHWGFTPGGTVFSVNPIDQARLLAVGFHHLLLRLVQADVPIAIIAFPRFAQDADYLSRKLSPLLPNQVPRAVARDVHSTTFSTAKIRVESELRGKAYPPSVAGESRMPEFNVLDNAALKRCLNRLRERLTDAEGRCRKAEIECNCLRYGRAEELGLRQRHAGELGDAVIDAQRERLEILQAEVVALRESRSWRITQPLRSIAEAARRLARFSH
jgi:hypothetical protein